MRMMVEQDEARLLKIKLAAESIRVGLALGFNIEAIRGMAIENYSRPPPRAILRPWLKSKRSCPKKLPRDPRPGPLDRPGYHQRPVQRGGISSTVSIVAKGKEAGVPTPVNAAMTALVKRVEAGELAPDPQNIADL